MMAGAGEKPVPNPSAVSAQFWRAAAEGQLLIQRCTACGTIQHPAKAGCHACWSEALTWQRATGLGTVYSFTVVRRSMLPGFMGEEPYVVALIELAEGVRMTSNILDCPIEDVWIDMPVQARFTAVSPDVGLIHFVPRGDHKEEGL